ncbi:hypothetical protein Barb7_02223 [Bacteroidales bacterium Barb7]|nr:hypothetical protein Barb7_02223 [Bacteroidales bacterium Barb7]
MPSTPGSFKVCRFGFPAKQRLPIEARAWCLLKSMTDSCVPIKAPEPIMARSLPAVKSSDERSDSKKAWLPI